MKALFKNIAERVVKDIRSSRRNLSIAIAWFTNETIFDILLDKLTEGVSVDLIIINDHINNRKNGLDLNKFIKLGGKLYFSNSKKFMHNKFAIIDDKIVLTGSYNWTYNAEFRNNENIVVITNTVVIEQFRKEFKALIQNTTEQKDKVATPPEESNEINAKLYLKDDLVYKSKQADQEGEQKKSIEAIEEAIKIDPQDSELNIKIDEIKKKITPEYTYHVEDGQFSFDFTNSKLLGREGEIIKVPKDQYLDNSSYLDNFKERKAYILHIDNYHVLCIGNIKGKFPKDNSAHHRIKKLVIMLNALNVKIKWP